MALPTTVKVSDKTRRRLNQLKYRKGLKTLNDAIEHLLNELGEKKIEQNSDQTEAAEQLPPKPPGTTPRRAGRNAPNRPNPW